jgi:hypothetical protein
VGPWSEVSRIAFLEGKSGSSAFPHCCHSWAEPNVALDQTERLEGRLIESRRSLTRVSPAATPSTFAGAVCASAPCRMSLLGPTCLTDQGFSRRHRISYRGVKLPRVSAAFGRFYLRRGAGLPQVTQPFPALIRPACPDRARRDEPLAPSRMEISAPYRAAISAASGST